MVSEDQRKKLADTAQKLVATGKGILAADESFPNIEKKFASIGIPSTEENRRTYREMLFTTKGIGEFISGVILFDETIRQSTSDGKPFVEVLKAEGVIPGIKVDQGPKPLPESPLEKLTQGLEGLSERLFEYAKLGGRFTKWRAIITIGDGIPTKACLEQNAESLAEFARLSQDAGLVPIVEPEVLMDGGHSIETCEEVTTETLRIVFEKLAKRDIALEGMLLKPNMVLPGKDSPNKATPEEIREATIRTLKNTVPEFVLGIVFLSGGQTGIEATANLNALNKTGKHPWELSFSYGRALQADALKAWAGKQENAEAAQQAFYHRAKMNGLARYGRYTPEMENEL